MCRVVDTLLVDQETVYDPRRSNSRLLLGLKGSLNEYELDLLRHRGLEARWQKAQRGELILTAPVGYLAEEIGYVKDPDMRVQQAVRQVFDKFLELGTVRQVLFWYVEHDLPLPTRKYLNGRWHTLWRRPNYGAIYRMLTHPIYAGAYVYGQTKHDTRWEGGSPRSHIMTRPRGQAAVLLPHRHEGYISWDDFQRIQKMIEGNAIKGTGERAGGAARTGEALLTELLRCRRCGRKLTVRYTGREHDALRYCCFRAAQDNAEPRCINFGGTLVDETIAERVLEIVKPAAIEAAMLGAQTQTRQQAQVLQALELELKAAHYAAEHAQQQFDAVDPKNRLVADELERRWNQALERCGELEVRMQSERAQCRETEMPSKEELVMLANKLEELWHHPDTDMRLKKRIIRTVIEEVLADVDSCAGAVQLVVHWKGGVHTELTVSRRRRGQNRRHTPAPMVQAIELLARILPDSLIAGYLTQNGQRTGAGNFWTKEAVASARNCRQIPRYSPERQQAEGWMTLNQASALAGVSAKTLRRAAESREIPALHPLPEGPWIFRHADLETAQAKAFLNRIIHRQKQGSGPNSGQLPLSLSTT